MVNKFDVKTVGFSQALPRSLEKITSPKRDGIYQSLLAYGQFFYRSSRFPSDRFEPKFSGKIFPITVTG